MSSYKICKFCGEYEHDCKCAAAKQIKKLQQELSQVRGEIAGYQSACEGWQQRFVTENTEKNELKRERDLLAKQLEELKGDALIMAVKILSEQCKIVLTRAEVEKLPCGCNNMMRGEPDFTKCHRCLLLERFTK